MRQSLSALLFKQPTKQPTNQPTKQPTDQLAKRREALKGRPNDRSCDNWGHSAREGRREKYPLDIWIHLEVEALHTGLEQLKI